MAEGWARHLGAGIVEARSAGTKPAPAISDLAVEAMREKGVDISHQRPKPLTKELVDWSEIRISMGCGVERSCPSIYLDLFEDWAVEDPYKMPIGEYRRARDGIEHKVRRLISRIQDNLQ